MVAELEKIIRTVQVMPIELEAKNRFIIILDNIEDIVEREHLLCRDIYKAELDRIDAMINKPVIFYEKSDHIPVQRAIIQLCNRIVTENKKIFIVHGRNTVMRDKVAALLGRLKLDYVILDSEKNKGQTIIEKFIEEAKDCRYALIIFSADDLGGLNDSELNLKPRVRQNVLLEMGYFLGRLDRKNMLILHDAHNTIEMPTDFSGIVHEQLDDNGAWKNKVIKEFRANGIYIDSRLADRV